MRNSFRNEFPAMQMNQCTSEFQADYERRCVTIASDGMRSETREVFRISLDSRGRHRFEGFLPAGDGRTLHFAWLTDFRKRRNVILDLATGKPLELASGGTRGDRPASGAAASMQAPSCAA